jgi:hypothetical protein
VVPVVPGHHYLFYGVQGKQRHFNLYHFTPIPANLYLRIFPSEMFKASVRPQTAEIARTVEALLAALRVGEKATTSELRLAPITQRNVAALNGNFSGGVTAHLPPLCIQYENVRIFRQDSPLAPCCLGSASFYP